MVMAGSRPLKVVSEATRERETFRYTTTLLSGLSFYRDGMLPSSQTTAADCVLTGLAQLGIYQTGAERALVSFFDSGHQYIVAEATPSMRIAPNLPSESCPEPLTLCGVAIPRNQGTCDHVLYTNPSPHDEDSSELPISLVPNLTEDVRFSARPYCQSNSRQFYAGVPIRTRRGINIGTYCVMSTTQPQTWSEKSSQCLRDMSFAITEHLELQRAKHEARSYARVNRGLSSFIAGKGTLTGWQSGANVEAFAYDFNAEGGLDAEQQQQHEQDELLATQDQKFTNLRQTATQSAIAPPFDMNTRTSVPDDIEPSRIFSKAANIIREAFEVEGSIFLDVTLGSYRRPLFSNPVEEPSIPEVPGQAPMTSSSEEEPETSSRRIPDSALCDVLGFSTTETSSINSSAVRNRRVANVPKRFLAKLLRRYPNGKIFNFDDVGELQTSDSSATDDVLTPPPDNIDPLQPIGNTPITGWPHVPTQKKQLGVDFSRSQEGSLIRQAFPGTRSVAFIPIWDPKRERWFAGGFIYTLNPFRIFSANSELAFLEAFAKLIAAEVLNLEVSQADKAKSDALGSLSHELRSPLHGVILSTDLLNDTDLDIFQGNAVHTIETCSRTLLDTLEHLLDYSKINSFAAKKLPVSSENDGRGKRSKTNIFGKKTLSRHMRLDALIEDVVESVFAGFVFQHMSLDQLSKQIKSESVDIAANNRLDAELAMEQLSPSLNDANGNQIEFRNISVYTSIDPNCEWMFYIHPGAIRRITMNLLGNSLKYTTVGTIHVSLSQSPSRRSPNEQCVTLTVHDTGKGMSEDYLRHKLFMPFSQEDELTPGTGLGLSLVRRITSQLHGQISVESRTGVGTTVTVALPLEQSLPKSVDTEKCGDNDADFERQVRELTNLRILLQGFGPAWSKDGRMLVEDICRHWLHLDIVSDHAKTADIVLWSEDAWPGSLTDGTPLAELPNVIVCRDALVAYRLLARQKDARQDRIFEYVSQPLGPRVLARSLLFAYKRWAGLSKLSAPVVKRPPGPTRTQNSHSKQLPAVKATGGYAHAVAQTTDVPVNELADLHIGIASPAGGGVPSANSLSSEKGNSKLTTRAPRKFLLVDDNHINLKVLSAYISKLGQAYEAVTNGKEAVDAYTENPGRFAAILMDISMPVMDGLEATRKVRAHERRGQLCAVAVLALTGLSSDRIHQEALESGVDIFLTKPVSLSTLREALASCGLVPVIKTDASAGQRGTKSHVLES